MQTVTIKEARERVGALTKIEFTGKTLVIFGNKGQYVLKPSPPKKTAVRIRPAGYFNDLYSSAEAAESNRIGVKAPRKLVL